MSVSSKTIFFLLFVLSGFALASAFARYNSKVVVTSAAIQQSNSKEKNKPDEDIMPIAEYDAIAPADPVLRARRIAKGKRYNGSGKISEISPAYTQECGAIDFEVRSKSTHWINEVPDLPVKQSSVILVGRVIDAEAFLSTDKTSIYSEFKVEVETAFKNTASQPLYHIVVDRLGGAVRFPSGRIQRFNFFRGQRMPQIGRRYILFLNHQMSGQDPSILTGYELSEGQILALDNLPPYSNYNQWSESKFLKLLEETIEKEAKK